MALVKWSRWPFKSAGTSETFEIKHPYYLDLPIHKSGFMVPIDWFSRKSLKISGESKSERGFWPALQVVSDQNLLLELFRRFAKGDKM